MKRPTLYYFRNLLCVVAEEKKKKMFTSGLQSTIWCFAFYFFSVFIFFIFFLFLDALFGANLTFYA